MPHNDISSLFVYLHSSIRETVECIDRSGRVSIALVIDNNRHLLATITDGDIRRFILAGFTLETLICDALPIKNNLPNSKPVIAPIGSDNDFLLDLMRERSVRQIPLLDKDGKVGDIVILQDILPQQTIPIKALVMAGGFGTRLKPLTDNVPKPMISLGDKPILEFIINSLYKAGIRNIYISTHFKPEVITQYFGDGIKMGVKITYLHEDQPLGTAGAIKLIPNLKEPLLVINGDILTAVNYQSLINFHQEYNSDLTMGARSYSIQIPFGVIERNGFCVSRIIEKPLFNYFVNAGIYVLNPNVCDYIPIGKRFDMTELIQVLINSNKTVISFPIMEYWQDIGQHDDYRQAIQDFNNGKFNFEET